MAFAGTAMAADVTVTVDVVGPAGQINHGQVVSNFVRALKEQLNEVGRRAGIGCLVRLVAQSDDGKGEEQVRPTASVQSGTTAVTEVVTIDDAACEPGEDALADSDGPGKGHGHAYGHSKGVGNPHNANR